MSENTEKYDFKNYIKDAMRTNVENDSGIKNRISELDYNLLHGAIGLATESGEILDMIKKHIFYGREFDKVNLVEEIGDQIWYVALLLNDLGIDFESVMDINIKKLKKRFPDNFTEADANIRNLDAERDLLEREVSKESLLDKYGEYFDREESDNEEIEVFLNFLVENGCLADFFKNIDGQNQETKGLIVANSDAISGYFAWSRTDRNHGFWLDINKMWTVNNKRR